MTTGLPRLSQTVTPESSYEENAQAIKTVDVRSSVHSAKRLSINNRSVGREQTRQFDHKETPKNWRDILPRDVDFSWTGESTLQNDVWYARDSNQIHLGNDRVENKTHRMKKR